MLYYISYKCRVCRVGTYPFDDKKEIIIQDDASKDGLGSCLMQAGRIRAYASRSLTDTEKRYAQIEKELLLIVFAVRRFL